MLGMRFFFESQLILLTSYRKAGSSVQASAGSKPQEIQKLLIAYGSFECRLLHYQGNKIIHLRHFVLWQLAECTLYSCFIFYFFRTRATANCSWPLDRKTGVTQMLCTLQQMAQEPMRAWLCTCVQFYRSCRNLFSIAMVV
jgi:hypothetical protein